MTAGEKRKEPPSGDGANAAAGKKQKTKKQWQVPKRGGRFAGPEVKIDHGDAGIWATCDKGREAKAVGELKSLFQEYAETLYGDELGASGVDDDDETGGDVDDVEAEIKGEVEDMRRPAGEPLFRNVKIDIQCVIFMKTRNPVEPSSFVRAICRDLVDSGKRKTRFVKRLTPMTLMGKATEAGIEEVATQVLKPHFHSEDGQVKKFAIRTSIRNHGKTLTRDSIIKQVAALVGQGHKVDLKNPDLVILVEVYKLHCGMSVVQGDFDKLKRYNLAEIYEPTPTSQEA